ncbi:hypothetical protein [Flavobacterium xinjiangense]|uniref:Uncharacterized protein n=1 Tax=Flavobacterium xinjiangense TaxID=178356 RepID=A0A1M7H0N2_9FLAO|nr:hypothetical protein [Flavobacterium xinjiangense]SHM22145.1 hypothetical protein SAMN05216269_103125 [Flavobacterium xinjiangense]
MQTAPFVELLAVPAALAKNPLFDIIVEDKITIQNYCNALISKILELRQSQFPAFIDYQFNQVKNPEIWLNKFEKLLANNAEQFEGIRNNSKFIKLYTLIEKKRTHLQSSSVKEPITKTPKRLINAESEDRYFSFSEVKIHIGALTNYPDKILYLNEEICEYKQSEVYFINNKLLDYRKQCKALLKQIQNEKILKCQLEKEQADEKNKMALEIKPTFKIRINGPINILTDAYKQMMNDVKPNGKPYIEYKIIEIAKFICDNYLDENGNELSMLTIQTYLSPTRTDKNPNNDWKIKL